jgi:PAS domain-containing protein
VWDLKHRFIYANEALLTTWGKTREEAIGKTCLGLGYERAALAGGRSGPPGANPGEPAE